MRFVKGISLFFVIPTLMLVLGFGLGYMYERDFFLAENIGQPQELRPIPMTAQSDESLFPEEASGMPDEFLMHVGAADSIIAEFPKRSFENVEEVPAEEPPVFYLAIYDNRVVVLDRDRARIYLETDICLEELSEEEQRMLLETIRVRDEEELYSYLESFSS